MNIKIKHQIFWDTAKMVMIGKKSKSQFRNLTFHHKNLEKEQITSKKDKKKGNKQNNKAKSWFFEKSNIMEKSLARLTKKKREDTNYQ